MPSITLQVTNAGRAALVAAGTAGTLPVTITQVGLSATTTIVPAATMTALAGEHRRISGVGGAAVAADTIHLTARDESNAAYSVAAIALYLADGTMFAIYGQNTPILTKSAAAIMLLAVDVKFADIAASSLTFGNTNFLNPPATTEVQGVIELATNAEALTGTDTQRAIVPSALKYVFDNKLQNWVLKAGDTMTGTLRVNKIGGECIRIFAPENQSYITGYNADQTIRHGYLQFQASSTVLAADTGAIHLAPGGITRFTISAAGAASFTGSASVAGDLLFQADPNFYATKLAGEPAFVFDANDYFRFTRSTNVGQFVVGGVSVLGYTVGGASVGGTFSVSGASTLTGTVTATAGMISGGGIIVHAGGLSVNAGGMSVVGSVALTNSLQVGGGVALASGATFGDAAYAIAVDGVGPYIQGDAGDTLRFLRAPNTWRFSVGGATIQDISSAGVNLTGALTVTGAISQAGHQVWHAGNDGAGSGLDADLLDGFQASAFARLTTTVTFGDITASRGDGTGVVFLNAANTRYLHFNGSQYILPAAALQVNGANVWTAGNDGAGSGLDADLLDGLNASQFWRPDNDGAGSGLDADLLDGLQASQFWRPDNDGPDSGLDADTVDGFQASAFARVIASSSSAGGGYRIWSDGFKECWGTGLANANAYTSFSFPISFDSWSQSHVNGGATTADAKDNNPFVSSSSLTSLTMYNATTSVSVSWRAFGY